QTSASQGQIKWRGGVEQLPSKSPAQIKTDIENFARGNQTHFVLQLDSQLTETLRSKFTASGVTLLNYLGNNAYFASVDKTKLDSQRVSEIPGFARMSAIPVNRKLHEDLDHGIIRDWTIIPQNLAKEQAEGMGEEFDHDDQRGGNPIVAVYAKFHPDITLNPDGT